MASSTRPPRPSLQSSKANGGRKEGRRAEAHNGTEVEDINKDQKRSDQKNSSAAKSVQGAYVDRKGQSHGMEYLRSSGEKR